jgi:hypothetical protein
MLFEHKATPAEYKAGLDLAIARGWFELHSSGTFVRFTQAGAELRRRRKESVRPWSSQGSPDMTTASVAMPISVASPAICTQSHARRRSIEGNRWRGPVSRCA